MKSTLTASPLDSKTRFRVEIKHAVAIGPGKADLLQAIAETGSIAEAGRRLGMSYQRAWTLVAADQRRLRRAVGDETTGGRRWWRSPAHAAGGTGAGDLPVDRARRRTSGCQAAASTAGTDPPRRGRPVVGRGASGRALRQWQAFPWAAAETLAYPSERPYHHRHHIGPVATDLISTILEPWKCQPHCLHWPP